MPSGQTLCAIQWSWRERPGAHDWYDSPVNTPYTRAPDNEHFTLCWLRDEDVGANWTTAYVSPGSGMLTAADPGGDSIEVRGKTKEEGVLANTEPTGRARGEGVIVR